MVNYSENREVKKKAEKRFMESKNLEASYGILDFTVPDTAEEVYEEGHAMHNALSVPYFTDRVAEGELMLVFVRKDDMPYIDIAIKDNIVFHAVCECNRAVSDSDYSAIKKWAEDKGLVLKKKTAKELQAESEDSVVQY